MRILITGGTGYIGKRLVSRAVHAGHDVLLFSRSKPVEFGGDWSFYDLKVSLNIDFPENVDVIIHLAANTSGNIDLDSQHELAASRRLLRLAKARGARFVFVSSQTARADAPTEYGSMKWHIEQLVSNYGGCVVRPGQVYGGECKGVFGNIARLVEKLPALPAFIPAPQIQPIHLDDLCDGLLRIASNKHAKPRLYCLAAEVPCSFTKFLSLIASQRLRKHGLFIPLPTFLIYLLSLIVGSTFEKKIGITQLRSLFGLPMMKTTDDLADIGLVLRPLESGMHSSGSNKARLLLTEGRALLSYVLKTPPSTATLIRYARAIKQLKGGTPLALPTLLTTFPVLLTSLDSAKSAPGKELENFRWRLDTATLIAECTPSGAQRYLGKDKEIGISGVIAKITLLLIIDCVWRVIWFVCRRLRARWILRLEPK